MTNREQLTALTIELAERGYLPDRLLRHGIRRLCRRRLSADWDAARQLDDFIQRATSSPIALVPEKANQQHYELPVEFFQRILGTRLKYSCCYWEPQTRSLDAAEEAALRLTCEHAQLDNGQRILELGCGWGALTLWMAEQYPDGQITAVSNSHSQRAFIERVAAERGCGRNLQVITADMNDYQAEGRFDRVVSVEMFEHMRNHALLLERIAGWLTPTGKLLVHIFCHRERVYEFQDQGPADWMSRHFFTGGIMPSRGLLATYNRHMEVAETWQWGGIHYRKTADEWLKNMQRQRADVTRALQNTYGNDAGRWYQRWWMFFTACSELFGYAGGDEWFVMHYQLQPVQQKRS